VPLVIPPFVQYQSPLVPLRGLWNAKPVEGDRFVTAEVDWKVTTGATICVQFDLSGNSPVAFSQIAAFAIDNSRCASDVQFVFPDSGFVLDVPAYNQGVYPVFTNALMFYALAPTAVLGDITVFQVMNSVPPPVATQPSILQEAAIATNVSIYQSGLQNQIVPTNVSGTVNAYDIVLNVPSTTASGIPCEVWVQLVDGTNKILWNTYNQVPDNSVTTLHFEMSDLAIRFSGGIKLVVQSAAGLTNQAIGSVNLYYVIP
jgi:hypothetical protein